MEWAQAQGQGQGQGQGQVWEPVPVLALALALVQARAPGEELALVQALEPVQALVSAQGLELGYGNETSRCCFDDDTRLHPSHQNGPARTWCKRPQKRALQGFQVCSYLPFLVWRDTDNFVHAHDVFVRLHHFYMVFMRGLKTCNVH